MYLRLWPDVRMSDTTVCPLRWLMNTAFEWTIVHLSDEINVTILNVSECFESHSTKLTECSTFDGAINERKSRFPTNNGATRFIRSTSKLRFLQNRISKKFRMFPMPIDSLNEVASIVFFDDLMEIQPTIGIARIV